MCTVWESCLKSPAELLIGLDKQRTLVCCHAQILTNKPICTSSIHWDHCGVTLLTKRVWVCTCVCLEECCRSSFLCIFACVFRQALSPAGFCDRMGTVVQQHCTAPQFRTEAVVEKDRRQCRRITGLALILERRNCITEITFSFLPLKMH